MTGHDSASGRCGRIARPTERPKTNRSASSAINASQEKVTGNLYVSRPRTAKTPTMLGIVGGFSFAFNNVMLRREAGRPEEGRALAMFVGGALVAGVLAVLLTASGAIPALPAPAAPWLALAGALTVVFLAGNLCLQYGAARLPANRTAVVMTTEVLFAALSALALGGGTLTPRIALGGALIVAAALLAALEPGR